MSALTVYKGASDRVVAFVYGRHRSARMVRELRGHALWYAWGQIDAGVRFLDGAEMCTDDGFTFAEAYTEHAIDYEEGKVGSRTSILAAWDAYRRRQPVGAS